MKKNDRGYLRRDGSFVECELSRSDTYSDVVEKVSKFLGVGPHTNACLYRPRGGAIIPAQELVLNGKPVMWTLGSYMRVKHAGPDVIQIGVSSTGQVQSPMEVISCLQVKYGKFEKGAINLKKKLTREEISTLLKSKEKPFHPEHYDYHVTDIAEEDMISIYEEPKSSRFTVNDCLVSKHYGGDGEGLKILFQSPKAVILRGSEVSLYCVTNLMSILTIYDWHAPGSITLPSSPVVYVDKPGVYFCTVSHDNEEATSNTFHVSGARKVPTTQLDSTSAHYSISSEESSSAVQGTEAMQATESPTTLSGLTFPLTELEEATGQKRRENLLGEGGYGVVYRGRLRHTTVAVKFLSQEGTASLTNSTGGAMLKTELATLARFRHPNIVSVMGFSSDPLSAIVYEYISGGSLYDRLHNVCQYETGPLNWEERSTILRDTCRGLTYLHTAETPVVHQDIKSQNILIDRDGTGKISDFGFALELPKINDDGRSLFTATTFARSEGYFPSELTSGKYSPKSDVYSYGVVMLETFCARKAFSRERDDPKLVDHLEDELKDAIQFRTCQDAAISECSQEMSSFYHKVIVRCLSRHSKRPSSTEVMQEWEVEHRS